VYSAAFSPDGKRIITGSADGTVRIWDTQTGRETLSIVDDGTAKAWNYTQVRYQANEGVRMAPFYAVAFSPNGKRIVAAGFSQVAFVWFSDKKDADSVFGRP
jgi:WD40 repeat protein